MNKSDFNFKTKISRSLTDLQNSLDEACRLGLPPNLAVRLNDTEETYFCEPLDYNFQNDLTYKSASSNLERLIDQQQQQLRYAKYSKEYSENQKKQLVSNNCVGSHRNVYIDTLRMLAEIRTTLPRSQSSDAVNEIGESRNSIRNRSKVTSNRNTTKENPNDGKEIMALKKKLMEMNEEMMQLRNELVYRDVQLSARSGDFRSIESKCSDIDQEPYEDMKRHLQLYKQREAELLNQLNDAISTIEEAKLEEMQASMRAEQIKEDFDNIKIRFQEVVEANQKKIGNQNAFEEQFVQEKIMKLKNEVTKATDQLRLELASAALLADQLHSAQRENENLRAQLTGLQNEKCEQSDQLTTVVTKAHLQRDMAMADSAKLQQIIDRDRRNHAQEKAIMQEEMNELRTRLSSSENQHLNLAQDKMGLLNAQDRMKTELIQLVQANKADRAQLNNQFKLVVKQLEERITALQTELARKEKLYEAMLSDAEGVMRQQISLINKLKREYSLNVQGLDGFADRHRDELDSIHARFEQCAEELQVSKSQNRDLQQSLDNYGATLEFMKDSCRNLEEKKCNQDKEIIAHLSRQNDLMKTVELLTIQLQKIRARFPDCCCGAFDSIDHNTPESAFLGTIG